MERHRAGGCRTRGKGRSRTRGDRPGGENRTRSGRRRRVDGPRGGYRARTWNRLITRVVERTVILVIVDGIVLVDDSDRRRWPRERRSLPHDYRLRGTRRRGMVVMRLKQQVCADDDRDGPQPVVVGMTGMARRRRWRRRVIGVVGVMMPIAPTVLVVIVRVIVVGVIRYPSQPGGHRRRG